MPFMEGDGQQVLESLGDVELESLEVGHEKRRKRLVAVAILADMEKSGRTLAVVVKDYTYVHKIKGVELAVTVPEGFVTDFASIPRVFQGLIHPFGSHAPAAVLHDYLYAIGQRRGRKYADLLFLYAMQESGVRTWRARTMFLMVKLFGGGGYGLKDDWAFADSETGDLVPAAQWPSKIAWADPLLPQKKAGKAATLPTRHYERSASRSGPTEATASNKDTESEAGNDPQREIDEVDLSESRQTPQFGRGRGSERHQPTTKTFDADTEGRPPVDDIEATAFAPKTLRRHSPELIKVLVFRPSDRAQAKRRARAADPRAAEIGTRRALGEAARGTRVRVVFDATGLECRQTDLEAVWTGGTLEFDFVVTVEPDLGIRQAVCRIRIFLDDAQIGTIAFVRKLEARPNKDEAPVNALNLRRTRQVFISYSSKDIEKVALIVGAYQRANIPCFMDRTGLRSGEEWSPALLREIERADLFHLCWSQQAAASPEVARETEYALKQSRKKKRPDIAIQMLDGPPWAPHPPHLNALNFDDFLRAAIVGYAEGKARA